MKISIIVPVYNEEKTICSVLKKLISLRLKFKYEIIVIDDGSSDSTAKEIRKNKSSKIKIISHNKNSGKGAAIKSGIDSAKGDFVLIQDADLEYSPSEIINLLRPLENKSNTELRHTAVYGSRFLNKNTVIPKIYYWGNKVLTLFTNILYGVSLSDMETGYKVVPLNFIKKNNLKSSHFDIEPEITAKLIKNGIKIIEVPISYHGRTHLAGKKLTLQDAYGAVKALLFYRFFN